LRLIGYAALGLACLVLAAVSFVFIAAPVDLVRDRLVEEVRARTGRDLVVGGPVSMALFPTPGVTIDGVTLSDGPGQQGTLLSVQRISAQVSLSELLSRRVHVRRVVLSAPTLALRVDARGRRNWDFAATDAPAMGRIRYAQMRGPMRDAPVSGPAPGPSAVDPAQIREALAQILPGEIRIERGTLSYRDQRSADELDVSGIELEAAAAGPAAPVEAKGTFTLRGQPLAYTARLASLDAALSSGNADLVVKAEGPPLSADFAGTLALPRSGPALDGKLTLKSASIPALGLWLGRPVAMDGPAELSFSGRVQLARGQLSLPDFESAIAGQPAKGALAIDFTPRRPKITGQLQVASLDLGALLLRHPSDLPPGGAGTAPKADPIGDILRQQQQRTPQVRGFTQRKGGARDWSDERLDTRLLALVDADLRISTGQILHHELKTGPGRVAINLTDRNLRVDLEDIALYGGRGRGVATVDAAGATPAMSLNLTLEGVQAGPLLKDAADFEWLDGRTVIAVVIAGQGFSERELVETLSGTVEVKTVNGQLSGLNLPKLIRSLEMGQIPNVQIQPSEKTPFSELASTYVIQKGVAQNNDLRLVTANARITGTGVVQLPARTLTYDVRAKVSGTGASPQQGAVVNFSNIEIPLHIEGPWDKPVIGLKGQEQIVESIKQIGKNLKNPDVQDALRGLLGGGGEKSVKPGDLLNRLLKKE
jgi:AsmA protein